MLVIAAAVRARPPGADRRAVGAAAVVRGRLANRPERTRLTSTECQTAVRRGREQPDAATGSSGCPRTWPGRLRPRAAAGWSSRASPTATSSTPRTWSRSAPSSSPALPGLQIVYLAAGVRLGLVLTHRQRQSTSRAAEQPSGAFGRGHSAAALTRCALDPRMRRAGPRYARLPCRSDSRPGLPGIVASPPGARLRPCR